MRRINPSTLRRAQRIPATKCVWMPTLAPIRSLSTSLPIYYPRIRPQYARDSEDAKTGDQSGMEEIPEEIFVEETGSETASEETSVPFHEMVTSVCTPRLTDEALADDLKPLHHHLLMSFLPKNQPYTPSITPTKPLRPSVLQQGQWHSISLTDLEDIEDQSPPALPHAEPVLALVSPFEGGRHYVSDAVQRVASKLDADVLKFDLALGLGIDGPASPLGQAGFPAPLLPRSANPLMQDSARPLSPPSSFPNPFGSQEEDLDDAEDEGEPGRHGAIVVTPLSTRLPFGMPGGAQQESPAAVVKEEWVSFFAHWINQGEDGTTDNRKRIILLESVEAMAGSFDEWWPSFLEAVRRRRRIETSQGKGKLPLVKLSRPTTVILSSSPSLLLQHTASPPPPKEETDAAAQSLHPMLQEIAERLGGHVETRVEHQETGPIWWGSAETDESGRRERDGKRLAVLLEDGKGPQSLIPTLGSSTKPRTSSRPRHPILDLLAGNSSRQQADDGKQSDTLILKTMSIIPSERDFAQELIERIRTRSLLSAALIGKAIYEHGGRLVDPTTASTLVKVEPSSKKKRDAIPRFLRIAESSKPHVIKLAQGKPYRIASDSWQNAVRPWSSIRKLASATIGRILAERSDNQEPVLVQWRKVLEAAEAERQCQEKHSDMIKRLMPPKTSIKPALTLGGVPTPKSKTDPVVESIRKAKDLTTYEKRLLGSIVDTSKLSSTTFDDVHLPYKTIDGIRTVISLPLLFPEAFQGGVLKDHATTGALLFGPPGTGKTLLARAVANESGARMLAIQPSDVNDKYIGEGEKLVKAVFSLARRLSPCVVFLDEVDALFGARSARGSGVGHKAHDQLLTEFMQEMDGLSSAGLNKDKRIVVVGATNRPFDLDDAVLRRLPRRMLVDLPGAEDRKAILNILLKDEILGSDVNLENLARETDGFSGSDLKHLCVSAALAAVKDSVRVPWDKAVTLSTTPTLEAIQISSDSSTDTPSNTEQTAEASPDALEINTQPAGLLGQIDRVDPRLHIPKRTADAADQIVDLGSSTAKLPAVTPTDKGACTVSSNEDRVSSSDTNTAKILRPGPLPRTLLKKHFDVALSEIRPSSSEEGSLPELRKWAEQFGEGGTQRGRKKGFGKGFGFGDASVIPNREEGYGKVAQEE